MRRYMDDVIIATTASPDQFLMIVERFLKLCQKNGLRLKGPKTFIGVKYFNFLGKYIAQGQITASPHYVLGLLKVKPESYEIQVNKKTKYKFYVLKNLLFIKNLY